MYLNLLKTGIAVVFLLLIDFVIEMLLIRKMQYKKRSVKFRVALRYVLFFCFFFFMAKIWVEGFGYLLTFVGIISAALTITQKEYIMNFFGWLIIMWRDVFVEGDYIEIGKYSGYVHDIKPLYFAIEETSHLSWGDKTGRIVKIPNSLIATNPVMNFSVESSLVEDRLHYIFAMDSSLEIIQALIVQLELELKKVLSSVQQSPQFLLRITQDNPSGIKLKIKYFSLKKQQKKVEDKIFEVIMAFVRANPDTLKLAVVV